MQLGGATAARIDAPPVMAIFDPKAANMAAVESPLLQARLNAINRGLQPAEPAAAAQPVNVHVHYGAPDGANAGGDRAANDSLIPSTHKAGVDMTISAFCMVYNLSSTIFTRFDENGFTGTHAFAHMTKKNLTTELGFKMGEAIDIAVAVKKWAVANEE